MLTISFDAAVYVIRTSTSGKRLSQDAGNIVEYFFIEFFSKSFLEKKN